MKYIIAILISGLVLLTPLYVYGTQQDTTITINKSERIQEGNSSKYLIYTQEGVYENTDSFLRLKFNSSDVYNQLEAKKTYNCDTYGWRIPLFSVYPNIVSCKLQTSLLGDNNG